MKLERSTYQKPLSLTGLGGGATSLSFAGASGAPAGFILTLNDSTKPDQVSDVKVGSDGSIYGCGMTQISGCGDTGLVFKTDASGNVKWQRYLCNNGNFGGITLDSSDNVIVVARSSTGGYAGNVVKYNSSGVLQWQKRLANSSHYLNFNSVDVDSSDNIYATGYMQLTSGGNGTYRPLVAKINSSGVLQWFRIFKGMYLGQELSYFYTTYNMDCWGCKVDSSANVYITGRITAQSNSGAYAAKINSSGTWQWTTFLKHGNQNPGSGIGWGINTDSSGNVYICGYGTSPAENGNQGSDAFVAKFNSSGTYQWINFYGSTIQGDEAKGVVVDSSGNIYVTGVVNNGSSSLLALSITKFKSYPTGGNIYINRSQIEWQRVIRNFGEYDSGSKYVYGNSITLDSDGNVYVGGYTNKSTQNWGNSDNEVVIAKIPSDGSLTGTYSFGSSNWIYTDGQYIYNSYFLNTAAASNYWQNGGNYVGNTSISFVDISNLYSCPFTTSTFTDSTTSMNSAVTLFE